MTEQSHADLRAVSGLTTWCHQTLHALQLTLGILIKETL